MSALEGAEVKRADETALARGSAAASVPSSATAANPPYWRFILMRSALVAITFVVVGMTLAAYAAGLTVLQIGGALS